MKVLLEAKASVNTKADVRMILCLFIYGSMILCLFIYVCVPPLGCVGVFG